MDRGDRIGREARACHIEALGLADEDAWRGADLDDGRAIPGADLLASRIRPRGAVLDRERGIERTTDGRVFWGWMRSSDMDIDVERGQGKAYLRLDTDALRPSQTLLLPVWQPVRATTVCVRWDACARTGGGGGRGGARTTPPLRIRRKCGQHNASAGPRGGREERVDWEGGTTERSAKLLRARKEGEAMGRWNWCARFLLSRSSARALR
ncbi:hypothetical protein DFH09DRAFT_485239 [Mycena vulgaris]|nr:hypothetical protein DFH09DRAFT_485239 [Mycena vulgaris]